MNNSQSKPLRANNFDRLRLLSIIGGFLDGQPFEFSNDLNCLSGARGTGNNTSLELIRCALNVPLTAMSGHGLDFPDLAARTMEHDAVDHANKNAPATSNTRDCIDTQAMTQTPTADRGADIPRPFTGSELVFYTDRVTLCGITVVKGLTRMRKILEVLREKRADGKFVAYSGDKLASKIGALGGQNAISEAVKKFRDKVIGELASAGIACGREDVLLSRGCGYRLADTITVRLVEQ